MRHGGGGWGWAEARYSSLATFPKPANCGRLSSSKVGWGGDEEEEWQRVLESQEYLVVCYRATRMAASSRMWQLAMVLTQQKEHQGVEVSATEGDDGMF